MTGIFSIRLTPALAAAALLGGGLFAFGQAEREQPRRESPEREQPRREFPERELPRRPFQPEGPREGFAPPGPSEGMRGAGPFFMPIFGVLNEDQRAMLREELEANRDKMRELNEQMVQARRQLQQAMFGEETDETKLRRLSAEIGAIEGQLAVLQSRAFAKVRPTLTPDQLERLRNMESGRGFIPQRQGRPDQPFEPERRPEMRREGGERPEFRPDEPRRPRPEGRPAEPDRPRRPAPETDRDR